jgi:hypothetical protein
MLHSIVTTYQQTTTIRLDGIHHCISRYTITVMGITFTIENMVTMLILQTRLLSSTATVDSLEALVDFSSAAASLELSSGAQSLEDARIMVMEKVVAKRKRKLLKQLRSLKQLLRNKISDKANQLDLVNIIKWEINSQCNMDSNSKCNQDMDSKCNQDMDSKCNQDMDNKCQCNQVINNIDIDFHTILI